MPRQRQEYDEFEEPASCMVELPPAIAKFVYREYRARGYRTATELVVYIMRRWADDLEPMSNTQWKKLVAQMKEEEDAKDAKGKGRPGQRAG